MILYFRLLLDIILASSIMLLLQGTLLDASNFNTAYQIDRIGNAMNRMNQPWPSDPTTTPNPKAWEPNHSVRECAPGGKCGMGGGMMGGFSGMKGFGGGGDEDCECPRGYVCKLPNNEETGERMGFEMRCEKTYL